MVDFRLRYHRGFVCGLFAKKIGIATSFFFFAEFCALMLAVEFSFKKGSGGEEFGLN